MLTEPVNLLYLWPILFFSQFHDKGHEQYKIISTLYLQSILQHHEENMSAYLVLSQRL